MKIIDKIGFIISLTCVVHCTILPLLLVSLPYFAISIFLSETVELYIVIASLILSVCSVCLGIRNHKNIKLIPFLSVGLIFILIGKFLYTHDAHTDINLYMIFGGTIIGLSHLINYKLCKKCKKCNYNERY